MLCSSLHTFSSHHLDQVTLELLKAGAAVDKQGTQEFTALMFAAQNGHAQVCSSRTAGVCMVEFSLAHFHMFCSHHLDQVALELLKAGADVNAIQQNELKWTALMFAAQGGHAQVCSSRTAGVCMEVYFSHVLFTPS